MENKKLIKEEIFRIKEIMGIPLNEQVNPKMLQIVDEFIDALKGGGNVNALKLQDLNAIRAEMIAARTDAEVSSALTKLFSKGSRFYSEIISHIKLNNADVIDDLVYRMSELGKKLKAQGESQDAIDNAMKNLYSEQTNKWYFGSDLKDEIFTKAKNKVLIYDVDFTMADDLINTLKNKPEFKKLYKKFGAQIQAELDELRAKWPQIKSATAFNDELTKMEQRWTTKFPAPAGFWSKVFRRIKSVLFAVNDKGAIDWAKSWKRPGHLALWIMMISLAGYFLYKFFDGIWGEGKSPTEVIVGGVSDEAAGAGGVIMKTIESAFGPRGGKKPITPEDIEKAEETY